jgi:hypothetical protein
MGLKPEAIFLWSINFLTLELLIQNRNLLNTLSSVFKVKRKKQIPNIKSFSPLGNSSEKRKISPYKTVS